MSCEQLIIFGAGGHGRVVADVAILSKRYSKIAFIDANKDLNISMGLEVISHTDDISPYIHECEIFVAVGNNGTREKLQKKFESQGAIIATLVHPNAVIGGEVQIDRGTVIMAGVIINHGTKIGKGCIINTGATIDHDNKIEDYVHISPGAHLAGNVSVGTSTWVCIGSSVINGVSITSNCVIGAGAVVVRDISEAGTYIGTPAKLK